MKNMALFFYLLIGSMTLVMAQDIDFKYMEALKFRNIGPAGMSGRVTAIDVNLSNKDHIIIGSASGGVWESKNGGITWKPIFDDQATLSIGAVKINQMNPSEIWVGTGEGNPRNSHNSGAGIFKSIDGGKTWNYMGLKATKLIHRIIINDFNTNHIVVGAMGSAWGASSDRGVYVSKDGGKNWIKTLYVADNVGVADMVSDPYNSNKIIASMWEFGRTPWGFNSGGKGSGIYLSYDGGETWKKITNKEGLPKGNIGRVGLAYAPSEPDLVYALIEAKDNGLFKSTDGGENWTLVTNKNVGNRPFYYADIYVDPQNENRIYNLWSYVSMSEDGGKTFKTIADYGNNVHPDHHAFWIDPDDPHYIIDGNDGGLNISRDGAKSWQFVANLPIGQFYHVDIDDDFPYNVYGGMQDNGSWVGPGFVLKRGGIRNYDWQELYFGDGFDVAPRSDNNRYGYAMSQGGNVVMWDKETGRTEFIQPQHPDGDELRYNWNAAMALDPYADCGLYFGSQYVHYTSDCGNSWKIISPDLTTNDSIKQDQSKSGGLTLDVTGAENHTTILCIEPSPHDKNTIWVGTDDGQLQLSTDAGRSWSNLTSRLPSFPQGAFIPQIVTSKQNKEEVFVVVNNYRQNDWAAYLYHSSNNGATWKRIVKDNDIPSFVCSVVQDPVEEDLLFLGTDVGLYFSLDHGNRWIKWDKGLPSVQIRDMKIQETHDDLVLGTFGRAFWILDDIEPLREMSRIGLKALLDTPFKIMIPNTAYKTEYRSYNGIRFIAQGEFVGDNKARAALFTIWNKPMEEDEDDKSMAKLNKEKADNNDDSATETLDKKDDKTQKKQELKVLCIDKKGDTLRTFTRKLKPGFNRITWNPSSKGINYPSRKKADKKIEPGGMPILSGDYKMVFEYGQHKDSTMLTIANDPRLDPNDIDTEAKYLAMDEYNKYIVAATEAFNTLKKAKESMSLYNKIVKMQEDTIVKKYEKKHKALSAQIDSIENLFMLPEPPKPQYEDSSHTLMNKVFKGRSFLANSLSGPSPNGLHAIETAKLKIDEVLTVVNSFIITEWQQYLEDLKAIPLDLYEEFDPIDIKE